METYTHQASESGPKDVPRVAGAVDAVAALLTRDEKGELAIIRKLRDVMDEAFTLPGTKLKIGLDPIIGLIPGIGDLTGAAIGGYVLHAANKLGVPTVVMARMLLNLVIDALIGIIPIVGDYLDVLYKANSKNVALVEQAVLNRETTARSSWWRLAGVFAAFGAIVIGGFVGAVFLAKWIWTMAI